MRTKTENALRFKSKLRSAAGGAGSGGLGCADEWLDGAAGGGKDCGRMAWWQN